MNKMLFKFRTSYNLDVEVLIQLRKLHKRSLGMCRTMVMVLLPGFLVSTVTQRHYHPSFSPPLQPNMFVHSQAPQVPKREKMSSWPENDEFSFSPGAAFR